MRTAQKQYSKRVIGVTKNNKRRSLSESVSRQTLRRAHLSLVIKARFQDARGVIHAGNDITTGSGVKPRFIVARTIIYSVAKITVTYIVSAV